MISFSVDVFHIRNAAYVLAALFVALAHNVITSGEYWFDSVLAFAISWFIGYVGLIMASIVYFLVLVTIDRSILRSPEKAIEDPLVHFCLTVITCSVAMVLIFH